MSRRPGIASGWYAKFKTDVFPSDEVVHKGRAFKPPRFYENIYQHESPAGFVTLKKSRVRKARKHKADQTSDRLITREIVKLAQIKSLSRSYENET
jgi:hypothetical protein